jgi:hypothetical protein
MTASGTKPLRMFFLFMGGVLLNVALYVVAGAMLIKQFDLQGQVLQAQHSAAAYGGLTNSFRTKDLWADFAVVPIIGCLIGLYAALLERKKPGLLAVACLLPMFLYEVISQPVGAWSVLGDIRYFGARAVGFLAAVGVALSLRGFLNRRRSPNRVPA